MVDILLSWNPSGVFTNMPSCLSGYLTSVSFLALLFLFLGFCLCSLTLRNLQGILGLENTFVFYNCATHHCSSCDHLSIPDLADAARVCMFLVGSPMPLSYHCPLPHQHHWLTWSCQDPSRSTLYPGSPQTSPGGQDSQVCVYPRTNPQTALHGLFLTSFPTFPTPETFLCACGSHGSFTKFHCQFSFS